MGSGGSKEAVSLSDYTFDMRFAARMLRKQQTKYLQSSGASLREAKRAIRRGDESAAVSLATKAAEYQNLSNRAISLACKMDVLAAKLEHLEQIDQASVGMGSALAAISLATSPESLEGLESAVDDLAIAMQSITNAVENASVPDAAAQMDHDRALAWVRDEVAQDVMSSMPVLDGAPVMESIRQMKKLKN